MRIHANVIRLFLVTLLALAAGASPPDLMSIDDIRPGMTGIGKTVFAGTEIEEFQVEILAVLKNDGRHGDAIMAAVSGGPLPIEKVGVVAGMSGSPIYIDGKLIGALAFGQSFGQAPMIAGITPIHEMLADAAANDRRSGGPVAWSNSPVEGQWWQAAPILTPLVVSGGDSRLLPLIRAELAAFALTPIQGGSATSAMLAEFSPELEPGAAVGVQLMRGAMSITGVGTVTHRDGDRILAFGHPMFWAGAVNLPMTSAYVHFVWSNQFLPFKVTSPLHTLGAITQDRRTGISGSLGLTPRMIPLTVSVTYRDQQWPDKQYDFEVIDHDAFTPLLLGIGGLEAILAAEGPMGKATVRTQATIEFRNYPDVVLDTVATSDRELLLSALRAFTPLHAVLNNPFEPVTLERVSLKLTVSHDIRAAELVGARIEKDVVRAGETLAVMLDLRPYGADELVTLVETLTIPDVLQNETVQLVMCDAAGTSMLEANRATGKFQPQNVAQVIALVNERISADTLVLSLLQIQPGLVVEGRELPSPPLSMLTLMGTARRSATQTSIARGRVVMRKRVPTAYVVSGCTALGLRVDHSGGNPNDGIQPEEQGDQEL